MIGKPGSEVKVLYARANKTAVERDMGQPHQAGDHGLLDGHYTLTPATYATASQRKKRRAYGRAFNLYEAVLKVPGGGYYAPGVDRNFASAQAVLNTFVKAAAGDDPEVFEWW